MIKKILTSGVLIICSLSSSRLFAGPIIPVSEDDSRVTPAFSALGNMIQVDSLILSGVASDKMNRFQAIKFCESIGGTVPTIEEWGVVRHAMYVDSEYRLDSIPGLEEETDFWALDRFYGDEFGNIFSFELKFHYHADANRLIAVRCVMPSGI